MENNEKINLLICGSQKFEDKAFVFGMLNSFYQTWQEESLDIGVIHTSRFSGACQYAREWVNLINDVRGDNKIEHRDFQLDNYLATKNLSLYEDVSIPDFILKQDKFFIEGSKQLVTTGTQLVLAFPNAQGELGVSTRNIMRFAQLATIDVLDCVDAWKKINQYRVENGLAVASDEVIKPEAETKGGLENRRTVKKY